MNAAVADRSIFSELECQDIWARVQALRDHWQQRHASAPFFTLGAAAYLDGDQAGAPRYFEQVKRTRDLLATHFARELELLRATLSDALQSECTFDARVGLPGFHIYLADPIFQQRMGTIHIDLQFENIPWQGIGTPDFSEQYSLTLALRLPRSGGGLKYWEIDGRKIRGASAQERAALLADKPQAKLHAYQTGHLAIHSGFLFHQIAPISALENDDVRCTLQAHALRVDGRWLIYW